MFEIDRRYLICSPLIDIHTGSCMRDRLVRGVLGAVSLRPDFARTVVKDGAGLSFDTCNRAVLPLMETMRTRGLRALARSSRERALASRLELTAFQQRASAVQFADAVRDASTALWFETRKFGFNLGITEGIALRSAHAAEWAVHIANETGSAVTQLTAPAPEEFAGREAETVRLASKRGWLLTRTRARFREVMLLGPSYEATLTMLGKHTRRNIRIARKTAAATDLTFTFSRDGTKILREAHVELGQTTEPYPLAEPRMRRFEAYADMAGQPFRSVITSVTGTILSYSCGFIDKQSAYLIYQLNSSKWSELGPSLMHRAYLIEALADLRCQELVFVHGCSGILTHACLPMDFDRFIVLRDTAAGRATASLIRKLRPKSRIGRVLTAAGDELISQSEPEMTPDR
jgi:hypothetical protein